MYLISPNLSFAYCSFIDLLCIVAKAHVSSPCQFCRQTETAKRKKSNQTELLMAKRYSNNFRLPHWLVCLILIRRKCHFENKKVNLPIKFLHVYTLLAVPWIIFGVSITVQLAGEN